MWSFLSKIWLKASKTCDISCFLQCCQFLPLFETLSKFCLKRETNEVHFFIVYVMMQLLMYDNSHLNFQPQKVYWGSSGRQNWRKSMEVWYGIYVHFIRNPKGITYVGFFLQINSQGKMTWSKLNIIVIMFH